MTGRLQGEITTMPCSWCGCAISGLNAIRAGPYLSDDLVWAFPVGCELAMLICVCYSFCSAKNKVAYLDWLQFYCSVMEMQDTGLIKCFLEDGISSNRGEEIQGFSKCCVV